MNLEGLTEKWSNNPAISKRVKYYENMDGDMVAKVCTKCAKTKSMDDYGKNKGKLGGRKSECKSCKSESNRKWNKSNKEHMAKLVRKWYEENKERKDESVRRWNKDNPDRIILKDQRRRARKKLLPDDFTTDQMSDTLISFRGGCALTGDTTDIHWDHVIPLVTGHVGTVYGNMIPLRGDLNLSKSDANIFKWFEANKQRFDLDQLQFDRLVDWLAVTNGMTVEEYTEYVYQCYENPNKIDDIKAN
jgi:hypothetical protein